jgi:hypothetical protein
MADTSRNSASSDSVPPVTETIEQQMLRRLE